MSDLMSLKGRKQLFLEIFKHYKKARKVFCKSFLKIFLVVFKYQKKRLCKKLSYCGKVFYFLKIKIQRG
ncbi:MAG: hypothetical protein COX30_00660 [Candidatus Moranbacteria bacterium CG23_combo_of_CG06-09_8_20_14_all_39_10]|nr:MAG: hypothetical protein COX30_00660 [Candidatus Moranbacteria bacterium CG23_combo_of_CG06-09_8_20_14_all_39_10]